MQDLTVGSIAGWMVTVLKRLEPFESFVLLTHDFVGGRERGPIGADGECGPSLVFQVRAGRCHVDLLLLELLSLRAEVKALARCARSHPLCLFDFIIHHLA